MNVNWGDVRQLGFVVEDLDQSIAAWTQHQRVGPWLIMRNVTLSAVYRGQPTAPRLDIGFGYRGELQIELIQQTNDAPSPYRPFIEQRRFGLHHYAFVSDRVDELVREAQAAGLPVVFDINMNGGRYVYFDSPVRGEQTYIEVLQATPSIRQMFEHGIPAAKAWDGKGQPTVIDFAKMSR